MCSRCGGSGWIFAFSHVEDGRCFKCNPDGLRTVVANHTPAPISTFEPAINYLVSWGVRGTSESKRESESFEFEYEAWAKVATILASSDNTAVSVFAPEGSKLETGKSFWCHR